MSVTVWYFKSRWAPNYSGADCWSSSSTYSIICKTKADIANWRKVWSDPIWITCRYIFTKWSETACLLGQTMVSGETVIADLTSKEVARAGRKE